MDYEVHFKPQAIKDLADLPKMIVRRIIAKVERMQMDLAGDVKRLTSHFPAYRLRVGDYRVLFHVENNRVDIYRVVNRRDAYE